MFKTIEFIFNINEKENEYLSLKYIDITNDFINQNDFKNHDVLDAKYFKTNNGTKYIVDGKNVVLDYSKEEKDVAIWLTKTFGGKIYMLPRVNNPDGIQTADYLFYGEKWDLKKTNSSSMFAIDYLIKKKKTQANNFIIDITNSPHSVEKIIKQINKIYNSNRRNWVDKFIIKKDNNLVIVLKRKKEIDPNTSASGPIS